jgi:RimJ/RimL family protein N-acetyltransferase
MPVNCFLRPADSSDLHIVFAWRNTAHIVELSLGQTTVDLETHRIWFQAAIEDPTRILYIIEDNDSVPAGLLRLDKNDASTATVTIYLDKPFMCKGMGTSVLTNIGVKAEWS